VILIVKAYWPISLPFYAQDTDRESHILSTLSVFHAPADAVIRFL